MAIKVSFLGFILAVGLKSAEAGEQPIYSGKTIAVVIATAPGETGNLRYTTVLKHLPSLGGMGGFDNLRGQVEQSRLMR